MASYAQGGWIQAGTTTGWGISLGVGNQQAKKAEYAGFDLAIGEVHGLRLWKVDSLGRLRARNWDKAPAWKPGINVARCLADYSVPTSVNGVIDPTGRGRKAVEIERQWSSGHTQPVIRVTWDDGSVSSESTLKFTNGIDGRHAAPHEDCTCGFYAYTDVEHEEIDGYLGREAYILGVVKGSGRTLIGTRGFRCEKAEVVALRDPTRGGKKSAPWRQSLRRKLERTYPDVPLLPSRSGLLDFADIESAQPDPSADEFWSIP